MSGSNYNISYCQTFESARRIQVSNLLNFFSINQQSDNRSLKEYLRKFSEDENEEVQLEFDFEFVVNEI